VAKVRDAMSAAGPHNLARLAEDSFERRGDYPSLLFEGRWHGSGELFDRGKRVAGGLAQLGLKAGDRAVVTMANCPEVAVVYNAVWRLGAVLTPATFLLPPKDLRHVIADAEARLVITTAELVATVEEATSGLEHVRVIEMPSAELERGDPLPIATRSDDDLAALLYTGGTTGRAKGVMLSHENLYFAGESAHRAAYVPGINRSLATLPLSHAYGLLTTIAALHSPERGVGVLLRWFDPVAFLALISEHRLQLSAVVPTMLQILLSQPLEGYDLSSLRYLTSGGAPLAPEVETEFCRRVPSVAIRQGYGLTESAALIATNPPGRERRGSVGLPVPGTAVRILDDEGRELAAGEVGEICCSSPAVMQGYWHSPGATAEAIQDRWLSTGDLGYLDEDGYLFIVDRKKDLIIRGGFNVYPRDVEDALVEHPAVEVAGVVGRRDEMHGEEVVAFVSLRDGVRIDASELIDWARRRIGGYKYPREVHVVEAVPLTPVGKVDRKALRMMLPATESGVTAVRHG
jgi:long-chain acyl-CoA synthetase